jgi:hypothetical protein
MVKRGLLLLLRILRGKKGSEMVGRVILAVILAAIFFVTMLFIISILSGRGVNIIGLIKDFWRFFGR